jgi:multisubunit Na+/H+ antiporter MnhE subunit
MWKQIAFWFAAWIGCAATWLVLSDNWSVAEVLTGVVAAAIGATGSELVRGRGIAQMRADARWLLRPLRMFAAAPRDLVLVITAVGRQALHREPQRGRLLVVPFDHGGETRDAHARRALAESFGSFAPNTIVIGIDVERDEIVAHQLVPDRTPKAAADPMGLA